ncbi:restriction endonuclease subunit S [Epilithonimonas hominis]|uniref:restriction endonuclease subunit S n=1 Tax=Epilithonimonas hominis TaxID=420404 RepID=UPI00289FD5A7|nr:restriction endonuclease subunit S [Epilithonimonas hominis]
MSKFVKLKDVCLKITDGAHYSPIGISKGFPMFSVKDMRHSGFDYSDCKYISESDYYDLVKADCKPKIHDVLIAKDGSYLKHVFVVKEEKDEVILSSIGILRPNLNKVNPYYLKYFLHINSVKETVSKKYVSGSALPRIILKNFAEIEIVNNDLSTQQKIASVLSTLDDKIELNNRINTELEAMAKTLYDYWFVQFDFPIVTSSGVEKPYKTSGGKMVYNETLKREIPEGWEVKKLGIICDIINGYAFKSEWYQEKGVKVIRTKNFENGYIDLNDLVYISNEKSIEFEKYYINRFDFLMVMVGASTGKNCIVNSNVLPALQNQNMWRFVSLQGVQLYLNLKLQDVILELERTTNGSARGFFQKDTFLNKEVIVPPLKLSERFSNLVKPIFNRIDNNLKQNQELSALRDWLLPMLMNGQVKVG